MGIPNDIERGFHVGGKNGAIWRNGAGQNSHHVLVCDAGCLMGMQTEHMLVDQFPRTIFNQADKTIAVFYGEVEISRHMRTSHPIRFFVWYLAAKNERFGASADAAEKRLDKNLVLLRDAERFLAEFAALL